jgi:hypothetical protein
MNKELNPFEQLMRDAVKPTQVPETLAKYADALIKGTHEITSMTIRPKREWVGLTDEDANEITMKAMKRITGDSNTFSLSAQKVWDAIIFEVEAVLKARNT